jgi:SAM-dependent methyltransferase
MIKEGISYDFKKCDLCDCHEYEILIINRGKSFLSDSRSSNIDLNKIICKNCGLIRNGYSINAEFFKNHYETDYILGKESVDNEPLIFLNNKIYKRSEYFYYYLMNILKNQNVDVSIKSVLEIGCGEGNLLSKFKNLTSVGVEPNIFSVNLAKSRGLNVIKGSYQNISGHYDLIYSFAVLEHLISPSHFFNTIRNHLTPGGYLFLCQPCQDYESFDIFFSDHIYHFNSEHINYYAKKYGFSVVDTKNLIPGIKNFSSHLLRVNDKYKKDIITYNKLLNSNVKSTITKFQKYFELLNKLVKNTKIVILGLGQTFDFYLTYSNLSFNSIDFGMDDNLSRVMNKKIPIRVYSIHEGLNKIKKKEIVVSTFKVSDELMAHLKSKEVTLLELI